MAKYLDDAGLKILWEKIKTQDSTVKNNVLSELSAKIGTKNGVASLDANGNVPLAQLGNIDTTFVEVVTELPTENIGKHLYLVKDSTVEGDLYAEYIYVTTTDSSGTTTSKWEKLGDFRTTVDLSGYLKTADANASYVAKVGTATTSATAVSAPLLNANGKTLGTVGISSATTSQAGLMSAADKTKLNGVATGAEVNQNAFSKVVVGSTTIEADSKTDTLTLAGSNVTLTPDATNDKLTIGITKANVTTALGYTPPTADTNTVHAYCSTAAATAAKVATFTGYVLRENNVFVLTLTTTNTAQSALTLNVNGTGAKPLYINGNASSTSNYTLPAGTYVVQYDGTNYQIRTTSVLPIKALNAASADSAISAQSATMADKLGAANVGSATKPMYLSEGKATACTYSLNKDVPANAVFTDTHWTSKNIVGNSATATANTTTALTNGNVYLNHIENSTKVSSHKISGSGATTVTTDTSGNIVITSTNTTYGTASTSANGLMTSAMVTKLNGIATGATADSALTETEINAILV